MILSSIGPTVVCTFDNDWSNDPSVPDS